MVPVVHELLRVAACGTEVNETELVTGPVVQEVGPVGVSLHQSESEQLHEA